MGFFGLSPSHFSAGHPGAAIPRFFAWGLSYSRWKTHHECMNHWFQGFSHFGLPTSLWSDPLAVLKTFKNHAGVVASGWHSPRSGWRVATCDASYGGCEVDWDTTPSGARPNADARDRRRCQLEDLRSGLILMMVLGGFNLLAQNSSPQNSGHNGRPSHQIFGFVGSDPFIKKNLARAT